jgi:hydroxyethylthiazole kinase-like uncharacterized protein yjeF
MSAGTPSATPVDEALLRTMPLPRHQEGADKDGRGSVLVVGGSLEVPGAALLAGIAALRAGAGRLRIATPRGIALHLALAVPEARVFGLEEAPSGDIAATAAEGLARRVGQCDAALIGPGMLDPEAAGGLAAGLLQRAEPGAGAAFVLDAAALHGLREESARPHAGRLVLTPHAGEMATLLGTAREAVERDPLAAGREAAAAWQAVVAMKGACTFVVTPQGRAWSCDRGNVGLATSGSGDTLAGIVAGLLARGAPPLEATLWGVFLHGEAGARLARRQGLLGYLARELLAEVPPIMAGFDAG